MKIKYILVSLPVILLIIAIVFSLWRLFAMNSTKNETAIRTGHGIDKLEKVKLGDIDQWILIRGEDISKPVMLFLHGGPGSPLFPSAVKLGRDCGLEKQFIMVYWEQRGTGKSYSPDIPVSSMTLDRLILDAHELVILLKKRFGVQCIYLMGRSWGSVLGLNFAQRYPEDLIAYIGIGQMVSGLENDRLSYEQTIMMAQRSGDIVAVKKLKEIGPPPWELKPLLYQRKVLANYGGVLHNKILQDRAGSDLVLSVLTAPEYSISDVFTLIFNPYFSVDYLWKYWTCTDFSTQIDKVEIPVYFLHGRHDYMVVNTLIEPFYKKLHAPKGKHLFWFEESGHYPEYEETEKYKQIVQSIVAQYPKRNL